MSSPYVIKTKDGEYVVQEEGYVTPRSVGKFKFVSDPMRDITNSLARGSRPNANPDTYNYVKNVRVHYPDKTVLRHMYITGCVAQYRSGKTKAEYGTDYVMIGIPEVVVRKIAADVSVPPIDVSYKSGTDIVEGYVWHNISLKRADFGGFYVGDVEETMAVELKEVLKRAKTNIIIDMWADVRLKYTGSYIRTEAEGKWSIGLGLIRGYIDRPTDVIGPTVADTTSHGRTSFVEARVTDPSILALLKDMRI